MDAKQAENSDALFTGPWGVIVKCVLFVAAIWALTALLRDALWGATLKLGPLGAFECYGGWVPFAAAVLLVALVLAFVFIRQWMKTGKRPSFQDIVKDSLQRLERELQTFKSAGAAPIESATAERPPVAVPAPASFVAAPAVEHPAPVAAPVIAPAPVAPVPTHV